MPCRFASSGTVATSRSASRAILALNVASNFLRDLVISVLHPLRQSRTLHTLTFGPISGVHFIPPITDILGGRLARLSSGGKECFHSISNIARMPPLASALPARLTRFYDLFAGWKLDSFLLI